MTITVTKEEYIALKVENEKLTRENELLKAGLDSVRAIAENVRGVVV
ncbi:hypothetical protein [Streptococcus acidominimus]|nr:hypothetical protein [Streptococcus acidominimus]MBF0818717.1 hypothetical protein [Streptococcus acidominimus]MBF0838339.1 hypothetical protein [Streptococcus acidominimus]MBF0848942.1 hypothetical protein [Streptococcus danieliae]